MANEENENLNNAPAPAPAAESKGEAKKPEKENVVIEKPNQCPMCKKGIKNKWYYRHGKYFCCKGCFQKDAKGVAAEEKSEAKPKA